LALLAVLALVATGCGGAEDDDPVVANTAPVDDTIEIKMVDVAFEPDVISVRAGTTVRFVFPNDGRAVHDATFGDEATQEAVADGKEKRQGVEVGPNNTKEYVYTFSQPGTLIIGCHQPGHYRQGMKVRVNVS
jgi:uncharacterized cupredoxin-like copper-binding protein